MEVFFENLLAHREPACRDILDFLGVRRRPLTTALLRFRQRPLSQAIENYDDLKAHFALTVWAGFCAK